MLLDKKVLNRLNEIGIALSKEQSTPALLEKILMSAKELTNADGGTIYMVTSQKTLHFEISSSSSLGFHLGGTSDQPTKIPDLPLLLESGEANESLMAAYSVNHKTTINIKDAYAEKGFDFSGTRLFDQTTGYRTRAVLTVPMKNHEDDVIAVLQLLNPIENGVPVHFTSEDEQLAESLASQAGIALTNQLLIEHLRSLFESLIRAIAEAIDEKSPSTGNHGKRVPVVAALLAKAVDQTEQGPFKETHFSKEELYELEVAAFLHDCGKITTPEHVVEKQHKLETIYDRIETIHARFEALFEKTEKELLQKKLDWFKSHCPTEYSKAEAFFLEEEQAFEKKIRQHKEDLVFVEKCNRLELPITEEAAKHLQEIAKLKSTSNQTLLTADELENLSIEKGNLTQKEREIIKNHVVMTYRMLCQLQYPKNLQEVPEIAASHHERVDGKGYPRGLKQNQMSVRARILAIADVFEALSAPDRPYKKALPLSEVLDIMQKMANEGHLDPGLFDVFLKQKVYLQYAHRYLSGEQVDVK